MEHHPERKKEKRLFLAILLNFLTTLAEVIGGIFSGSLALISDALHNLSDTTALVISLFAVRLSRRMSSLDKTFGYKRAEILAALFNSCILVVVSLFLFKEAFLRLNTLRPINGWTMLIVSLVGLFSNVFSVILLKTSAHRDLNIRTAYVHLFSDALSSFAVIIAAVAIVFLKIYWIDPLLTFIIGLYVLKEGYLIIQQSIHILMQNVPRGIKLREIQKAIEEINGVSDIHHVHVWSINEKDIHLEGHINLKEDMPVSKTCLLIREIEQMLKERFGIHHVTVQVEINSCKGVSLIKD
ncbi:MAG: cation diffusion facilitator family transporter [Candidatus Omnitrophica bacterium]|nr:cation diffusion facilitator family transporter [Candidatus Omnitrophota bacterium]